MSTKRKLEDKNHRTVGYIITRSDGKQHVEDVSGHTLPKGTGLTSLT